MLVIRLARAGRKKYPTYRIVAAEKRYATTGKFIEVLGHYNPHTKELVLNKDGIQKRVDTGAQPSNTVLRLMERDGMELPKWAKIEKKQRAPKKEPEAAAEVVSEAAEDSTSKSTPEPTAKVESAPVVDASAEAEVAEVASEAAAETKPDVQADPDDKAAASQAAQESAADAVEATTLDK